MPRYRFSALYSSVAKIAAVVGLVLGAMMSRRLAAPRGAFPRPPQPDPKHDTMDNIVASEAVLNTTGDLEARNIIAGL
ncbi:MAG: hypothetical protein AB8C13_07610 [Phycisphaerales bacterium]